MNDQSQQPCPSTLDDSKFRPAEPAAQVALTLFNSTLKESCRGGGDGFWTYHLTGRAILLEVPFDHMISANQRTQGNKGRKGICVIAIIALGVTSDKATVYNIPDSCRRILTSMPVWAFCLFHRQAIVFNLLFLIFSKERNVVTELNVSDNTIRSTPRPYESDFRVTYEGIFSQICGASCTG